MSRCFRCWPRAQLLGQHRECCALRGGSWGRKHAVVDYVFVHPREYLAAYHYRVIREMDRRGYRWSPPGGSPAIAEGFVPASGQTRGFSAF